MSEYGGPQGGLFQEEYRNTLSALYADRKLMRSYANRIGLGLFLVLLLGRYMQTWVLWLLSFLFSAEVQVRWAPLLGQLSYLLAYSLIFFLPTLLMKALLRIPFSVAAPLRLPKLSLALPGTLFCLGVSTIGNILTIFLLLFLQFFAGAAPELPAIPLPRGGTEVVLYFVTYAVAPAIFEELTFRGVILQSLRRFGDSFALVTSAILFSLAHGNIQQGINTFFMGLAFGYFVLRTGSLLFGMTAHLLSNGIVCLMELFSRELAPEAFGVLQSYVLGSYLLLGLVSLLYIGVRFGHLFALHPPRSRLRAGEKFGLFFSSAMPLLFVLFSAYKISSRFGGL